MGRGEDKERTENYRMGDKVVSSACFQVILLHI